MAQGVKDEALLKPGAAEELDGHQRAPGHDQRPGEADGAEALVEAEREAYLQGDGDRAEDLEVAEGDLPGLQHPIGVVVAVQLVVFVLVKDAEHQEKGPHGEECQRVDERPDDLT